MSTINRDTNVQYLPFVGPTMAGKLKRLGIKTVDDLLHHIPARYEDYSITSPIANLQEGEQVTIKGTIKEIKNIYTKTGKKIQEAKVADNAGELKVTWYNQPYLLNTLKKDVEVALSGKTKRFGARLVMVAPVYEVIRGLESIHTGRLVAIYPETAGVSSKWLRSRIHAALVILGDSIEDYLPQEIVNTYNLFSKKDALWQIHFPTSLDHAKHAKDRLSFDELLLIQLSSQIRKKEWKKEKVGLKFSIDEHKDKITDFIKNLPFTLTSDQNTVLKEILSDLKKDTPMNRLLQGEVGAGKTVVAAVALYSAYLNRYQSVLMAPTELLANQHYKTVSKLLAPIGLKVGIYTGKQKEFGTDVVIGTHAVLQKSLAMKNLGLIVIDEQQRFGVAQRALLKEKGASPHLLSMTATPIPRTLSLTLFGELDASFINELPKERKKVKTWVVPSEKRQNAYEWIKKGLKENGSQAYIICPFIEESETMTTVKAAKTEYEHLKKHIFPALKVSLLHGKLKTEERTKILSDFNAGKIDILIATPIVEVGIDVPNATIMLIEGSDRFGLTSLHQLRGRVGRGSKQGYCLLFTEIENPESLTRLKTLETTFVGSHIAEIDLKNRGAGDMYGLKQHGIKDSRLKVADFSNPILLERTKRQAKIFADKESELPSLLRKELKKYTIENVATD